MLILTRRIGERLMIGNDIKINVLGINKGQVKIGIDAPEHISIHREEIYDRILLDKLVEMEAKNHVHGKGL